MFAASANHPARFHQERRQRRGSLPLKKRRVCLDLDRAGSASSASPFFTYKPASVSIKQQLQQPPQVQQQETTDSIASGNQQHYKLALLPTLSVLSPTTTTKPPTTTLSGQQQGQLKFPGSSSPSPSANDTTKLTALSLIAAAAAAAQQVPTFSKQQQQQLPLLPPRMAPVTEEPSSGGAQGVDDESSHEDSSSSSDSDSSDDDEEQEIILSNSNSTPPDAITTIASGDSNMETKIRTSSSSCHYKNCKRSAGFQGSDYCKLHLLQVKKDKVNKKTMNTSGKKSLSSNNSSKQSSKTTATTTASTPTITNTSGQDKRYTGVEVRCCATTTRGRACAYIAVGATKYCHMHADYDTNPPPRRGLKSPTPSTSATAMVAGAASPSPKKAPTPSASGSKSRGNGNSSSNKAPTAPPAAVARRSSAKRAEKHADSPYPLLSMLSTDQWFQRKVEIAVGPLQGRVGSVQKWGNGWISVKIPGVAGLHNRRSFELYLQDADDNSNNSGAETTKKSQERAQGASSSKKRKAEAALAAAAEPETETGSMGLFRCVSRDVDVVSPSPSTDHSIRSARSFTPKLTASGSSSGIARAGKFSPSPETPTPLLAAGRTSSFLTPVPQKAAAAPPKVTPLLNEDAKPIVSLKNSCDRLQLPVTTGASDSKAMVFRPTAAAAAASNTN